MHQIDLTKCQAGDKLLTSLGSVLVYIGKYGTSSNYPHEVMYPDGSFGTRTDKGEMYMISKMEDYDHDIVQILPRHTKINTWTNPAPLPQSVNP